MAEQESDFSFIPAEITGTENGVGSDISLSLDYDAIKNARIEEDSRLSMGVWEHELKKADWPFVQSACIDILTNKSKDLQVVAWLIEARANINGLSSFPSSFCLLKSFLESFWYTCFPKDDERKYLTLSWLEERANTLLTVGKFADDVSLYDYDYALQMKALSKRSPEVELEIKRAAERESRRSLEDIQGILAGADLQKAQSILSNIRESIFPLLETMEKITKDGTRITFSKALDTTNRISRIISEYPMSDREEKPNDDDMPTDNSMLLAVGAEDRDSVYAEIQRLSNYLKTVEKHSPVPFILDMIVNWKDKTLLNIIDDLREGSGEAHKLLKILIQN